MTELKSQYRSHGEPVEADKPGGVTVFDVPMEFEKGPMKTRVTFRKNGDIARVVHPPA